MGIWARLLDGEQAYGEFHNLLARNTLENLWATHPPSSWMEIWVRLPV